VIEAATGEPLGNGWVSCSMPWTRRPNCSKLRTSRPRPMPSIVAETVLAVACATQPRRIGSDRPVHPESRPGRALLGKDSIGRSMTRRVRPPSGTRAVRRASARSASGVPRLTRRFRPPGMERLDHPAGVRCRRRSGSHPVGDHEVPSVSSNCLLRTLPIVFLGITSTTVQWAGTLYFAMSRAHRCCKRWINSGPSTPEDG
jgi:hypothetical protein